VLQNSTNRIQESQLLVPVPDGATVTGFVLEGLGESGIAKVLPRDEARRIYDNIVRRVRDPGLLEFAGYNLVRSSVFPVPANGEQSVRLTYQNVLPSHAGRVDYFLPRSRSLENRGVDWSFSVKIRSKDRVASVYSPSHEIETDRRGEKVLVTVPPSSARDDTGPFRLSYMVQREGRFELPATLIAYPDPAVGDGQGGYFLFLAGAPVGRPVDRQPVRRQVIVVLDRSGSMRGQKIEQAREAALQVLEGLQYGEAFNILDYSNAVEMFNHEPVIKTRSTMEQAREYLASLLPNGGTALHDALVETMRQPVTDGMLPVALFLTDGLPTIGVQSEKEIRQAVEKGNLHRRRLFMFGVGFDLTRRC
jgi:Ca-activated chloride channel family protein